MLLSYKPVHLQAQQHLQEECCVVDINDYSKYTWIYPLKKRSNVFQVFHNFQALVERQFDSKILSMQLDWGSEYEKLNSFFQKIGISHHVSCPHAHQQNGSRTQTSTYC